MVNDITDAEFEKKVLRSNLPVLVDFLATWCIPCKMVAPIVDKLSTRYECKVKFFKIDVDKNARIAGQYRVMSIPSLILFKGGAAVDTIVGAVPERTLVSHIDAVL